MRARRGELVDRLAIRNACQMLIMLDRDIYKEDFEEPFLQQSIDFYRVSNHLSDLCIGVLVLCNIRRLVNSDQVESHKYLQENSASVYVRKVEGWIAEEERASHYLDVDSKDSFMNLVEDELIQKHMETIEEVCVCPINNALFQACNNCK